jgi:hypothetical protein
LSRRWSGTPVIFDTVSAMMSTSTVPSIERLLLLPLGDCSLLLLLAELVRLIAQLRGALEVLRGLTASSLSFSRRETSVSVSLMSARLRPSARRRRRAPASSIDVDRLVRQEAAR